MNRLRAWSFVGSWPGWCLLVERSAQGPFSQSDNEKADALLKQMTVAEKIGQLNQPFYIKVPVPGDEGRSRSRLKIMYAVGEVGSFLFVTDPTRRSIGCKRSR